MCISARFRTPKISLPPVADLRKPRSSMAAAMVNGAGNAPDPNGSVSPISNSAKLQSKSSFSNKASDSNRRPLGGANEGSQRYADLLHLSDCALHTKRPNPPDPHVPRHHQMLMRLFVALSFSRAHARCQLNSFCFPLFPLPLTNSPSQITLSREDLQVYLS